jgi:iron-sulfur cluster assembly protein
MEQEKTIAAGQLVTISERARTQLISLGATGDSFLRISVIPGGCSGMTYNAAIDHAMAETDQVIYNDDALRVVADGGSAMFLDGLAIDYSDDLISSGFRFKNPKARKACGCGSSFAV